jgi:hypothetical protein
MGCVRLGRSRPGERGLHGGAQAVELGGAVAHPVKRPNPVDRTPSELVELLTNLLDDPELFGLAGVLEPDRAERLRWCAQRMLGLGVILLRGVV